MSYRKPTVLLMGQTPPPWHGQAVGTKILFDHEWPEYEVHRLRMDFSEEMHEVGRFQIRKIFRLLRLIRSARAVLKANPGAVLFYPPSSAKMIPYLRDLIFLNCVRHLAGATVYIFHASGLPVFVERHPLLRPLGMRAYRNAEVSLEVSQEEIPPRQVFDALDWSWCPCGIAVPDLTRKQKEPDEPYQVLFVGSLQEGKGILEILRTARILKDRSQTQYHFRIVGKWFSPEFEALARNLHRELGLEDCVSFDGQLTGDEKWQAYAKADLFFFPTHYESEATPIVIMEALGSGLPVISTKWAGIPAMLDGCASAELVQVRSPEAFATAIDSLSGDRSRAAETERISKAFYREKFLPERFIERVDAALRQACEIVRKRTTVEQGGESPEVSVARLNNVTACVYLADQNPGYDRSYGISRMSTVIMEALRTEPGITLQAIVSKSSQQPPVGIRQIRKLPWGTRRKAVRFLTDHLHPLQPCEKEEPDVYYFPKGHLPFLSVYCQPSVVTIHDTIIQYDGDNYPEWRPRREYHYWSSILKHTIRNATRILTVSESSKQQIRSFILRHHLPEREITVTYEPCAYEPIPQPIDPPKENFVIHLASSEPHKRTAHLIRWWLEEEKVGRSDLPSLHLIGNVPSDLADAVEKSASIIRRPFLSDGELQKAYSSALALILPSEIEGFGLPALEAYYMGTPVCFVKGTSVEEILGDAASKGGFSLDSRESLFRALDEVDSLNAGEIRAHGLALREKYAVKKIAVHMADIFREVAG